MKKINTLKKNYEFSNVIKRGNYHVKKQIIVYITKNNKNKNIIGIAISTKLCNAVNRNKIKRIIRGEITMEDFKESIKVDGVDANKALESSKEKLNQKVLELIEFIRNETKRIDPKLDPVNVFLNGNCGNLANMLMEKFPSLAQPYVIYYEKYPYHVVTKIGEKFYDITGETDIKKYNEYLNEHNRNPFDEEDFEIKEASYYDVRRQSDKYGYDENFGQSRIADQMEKLHEVVKNVNVQEK